MSDKPPEFAKGEYINSYYIGYDATGVGWVDAILFRIARAAKAYHSTESWCDVPYGSTDNEPTLNDLIQQAANAAADEIERLRAELARFVPTNDECLSDDGITASQAWRRT